MRLLEKCDIMANNHNNDSTKLTVGKTLKGSNGGDKNDSSTSGS